MSQLIRIDSIAPDKVKSSSGWPADIGETEDVMDKYATLGVAYVMVRPAPELPALIMNPASTEIQHVGVFGKDELMGWMRGTQAAATVIDHTYPRWWEETLPAGKPAASEKRRREPVAPWVRLSNCLPPWACADWECSVGEYDGTCVHPSGRNGVPAVYGKKEGDTGACEACAERAGVFGPVDTTWALPPGLPAPKAEPPAPTCVGPLRTHGTPALRVMGGAPDRCSGHLAPHGPPLLRVMGAGGDVYQLWSCDKCYLNHEKNIATPGLTPLHKKDLGAVQQPPARVGTVPQSLGRGAGIGIWASRGMR